jgi:hypothetical protein
MITLSLNKNFREETGRSSYRVLRDGLEIGSLLQMESSDWQLTRAGIPAGVYGSASEARKAINEGRDRKVMKHMEMLKVRHLRTIWK